MFAKMFRRKFDWVGGLLIVAAMAVVFGLSLWIGHSQSVWFDEAYSVYVAQQDWGRLIHLTIADVHPPLYYILLKSWMFIFGHGDLAWRSLSALCGALAAGVGLKLVARVFGKRALWFAWPFVVLAPFFLRYAFEVRMYALGSLISIAATYILVRLMTDPPARPKLWWLAYVCLVAAGLYTQYFIGAVWITHFLWCLALTYRRGQFKAIFHQPWLRAMALAGIAFLPWLPIFLVQSGPTHGYSWQPAPDYRDLAGTASFVVSYLPEWQIGPWQTIFTFGGLGLAIFFIVKMLRKISGQERQVATLLALMSLLPLILLYGLSLPPRRSIFMERYMALSILAFYLLVGIAVGWLLARRARWYYWLAAMGLILILAQGVVNVVRAGNYNYTRLIRPDMRGLAAYLKNEHADRDMIVVNEPQLWFELHTYWPETKIYFYNKDGEIGKLGGYLPLYHSPLQVRTPQDIRGGRVWYVWTVGPLRAPVPSHLHPTNIKADYNSYRTVLYADPR